MRGVAGSAAAIQVGNDRDLERGRRPLAPHRAAGRRASKRPPAALDEITATVQEVGRRAPSTRAQVVAAADERRQEERDRRAPGGRGDGRDRQIVAADQPDHRRHRRDRVPDQPAGAQRGRRGGARRRRRPRLRGRRLRSARARPALGRSGQGDQGADLDFDDAGRRRRQAGRARPARRWSASSAQVAEINGVVAEIAAGAQEQATGLAQVNTAISQMDQVTQQNAAMVEASRPPPALP